MRDNFWEKYLVQKKLRPERVAWTRVPLPLGREVKYKNRKKIAQVNEKETLTKVKKNRVVVDSLFLSSINCANNWARKERLVWYCDSNVDGTSAKPRRHTTHNSSPPCVSLSYSEGHQRRIGTGEVTASQSVWKDAFAALARQEDMHDVYPWETQIAQESAQEFKELSITTDLSNTAHVGTRMAGLRVSEIHTPKKNAFFLHNNLLWTYLYLHTWIAQKRYRQALYE